MLSRLLYGLTAHLPARLITKDERPYLERYHLLTIEGRLHAYLHRFVDADGDDALHDHPWDWAYSLVLSGGYVEQRLEAVDPREPTGVRLSFKTRGPGSWRVMGRDDWHRVVDVSPGTWTLFVHGPWAHAWGFLSAVRTMSQDGTRAVVDLIYRQEPRSAGGWWERAPVGRDVGREPATWMGGRFA